MPAVVDRVDHLYARVEEPHALFLTLSERLALPRSYGFARVPGFEGGAVSLGNVVFLEALRYAPGRKVPAPESPGLDGLALASPLRIADAATELSRRGIPHAPVVPFAGDPRPFSFGRPLREAGLRDSPGPLWSTVVLGGLLGDRERARQFRVIPSSGRSRIALALGRLQGWALTSRRLGDVVMARSMTSRPTVWIQQFEAADMTKASAVAEQELADAGGGALGLNRVREVVLAARDLERERRAWQRLLDPTEPGPDGAWHLGDGPSIRLIEDETDRIARLVCEVASLERAREFLEREDLLGEVTASAVGLSLAALQEVDIRLVEAPPPLSDHRSPGRR